MVWIFIGAIILTAALAFDFSRHCVEFDLTRNWTAADWALYRSYKHKTGQKNLSLANYCNVKLREKQIRENKCGSIH
jgi:hypothetical protein